MRPSHHGAKLHISIMGEHGQRPTCNAPACCSTSSCGLECHCGQDPNLHGLHSCCAGAITCLCAAQTGPACRRLTQTWSCAEQVSAMEGTRVLVYLPAPQVPAFFTDFTASCGSSMRVALVLAGSTAVIPAAGISSSPGPDQMYISEFSAQHCHQHVQHQQQSHQINELCQRSSHTGYADPSNWQQHLPRRPCCSCTCCVRPTGPKQQQHQ